MITSKQETQIKELLQEVIEDKPLINALEHKDTALLSEIMQHRWNMSAHYLGDKSYITVTSWTDYDDLKEDDVYKIILVYDKNYKVLKVEYRTAETLSDYKTYIDFSK